MQNVLEGTPGAAGPAEANGRCAQGDNARQPGHEFVRMRGVEPACRPLVSGTQPEQQTALSRARSIEDEVAVMRNLQATAMGRNISRRQLLKTAGAGFGYLALAGLLGENAA